MHTHSYMLVHTHMHTVSAFHQLACSLFSFVSSSCEKCRIILTLLLYHIYIYIYFTYQILQIHPVWKIQFSFSNFFSNFYSLFLILASQTYSSFLWVKLTVVWMMFAKATLPSCCFRKLIVHQMAHKLFMMTSSWLLLTKQKYQMVPDWSKKILLDAVTEAQKKLLVVQWWKDACAGYRRMNILYDVIACVCMKHLRYILLGTEADYWKGLEWLVYCVWKRKTRGHNLLGGGEKAQRW